MTSGRAQSLVEFALIAPIVLMLAMAAWDGGSVLRDQLVLEQAARDGARVGAAAYGGAPQGMIQDAVVASAADLPGLASSPGFLSVTSQTPSITVRVTYPHRLVTPVLRQLWGGGSGTLMLSASATFYVPPLTLVPATIVPSTPIPSATPTPSSTPTPLSTNTPTPLSTNAPTPLPTNTPTPLPTNTPTPLSTNTPTPLSTSTPTPLPTNTPTPLLTDTPTPLPTSTATPLPTPTPVPTACNTVPNSGPLPAINNNSGYWCTVRIISTVWIVAWWNDNGDPNNQIQIYANNPFANQPDPNTGAPPSGGLARNYRTSTGVLYGPSTTCLPPGTYTVYFYNRGSAAASSNANVSPYDCARYQF